MALFIKKLERPLSLNIAVSYSRELRFLPNSTQTKLRVKSLSIHFNGFTRYTVQSFTGIDVITAMVITELAVILMSESIIFRAQRAECSQREETSSIF